MLINRIQSVIKEKIWKKRVNKEIYKRNRQAPIQLKLDDMAIFINDKITRRGIEKGMIFVQEDLNKNILRAEKRTLEILMSLDLEFQYRSLMVIKQILKVEVWTDIRFLMINKAITPGEITELIRRQDEIDKDIERWGESMQKIYTPKGNISKLLFYIK